MKIIAVSFLLVLGIFGNGCAEFRSTDQPSDATTGPTFFLGELRHTEITTIERAWRGVHAALKDLNYRVKSNEHDLLQGTIIAVESGHDVKIHLEETSPTTTEIRIRAGTLGDKAVAREILTAIRKHIR
ncbi:MAG: hypothetical protein JWM68_4326 [Verrucomicrobiales bacterium]|nr:hypothetical protein [Verrucomicrobiales bacterium]